MVRVECFMVRLPRGEKARLVSITWSYLSTPSSSPPLVGYAELARDPETNDLRLPLRVIRGPDACVQRLRQRFAMVKGEWFLDQRLGLPYREFLLVKNPSVALVSTLVRRVILDTPGFASVPKIAASVDKRRRELSINFEALLEDPNVIVRGVNAPFLL